MVRPLISVVIPIYNVEKYIEQAIKSVLNQSIDFNLIDLILIDDGSTDNSGSIAKQFADIYENVTYKRIHNQGVSNARNVGMKMARGTYIHFLDADDLLSKHFYKQSIRFLKSHNSIPFVASKIMFFDESIDSHPLNYKFKKTRVIKLSEEPNNPILHAATVVFRRESIRGHQFDTELSISEDAKFLGEVLARNQSYGVLRSTIYYYRKRGESSAIGGSVKNKSYYLDVPQKVYTALIDTWRQHASSTESIEYTILYDLSYRLVQKSQSILSSSEERKYKDSIKSLAHNMSDKAICETKFLNAHQKVFLLKIKYGNKYSASISVKRDGVYFDTYKLENLQQSAVHIDFITKLEGDTYKVEGYNNTYLPSIQTQLFIATQQDMQQVRSTDRAQREQRFLDEVYDSGGAFEVYFKAPKNTTFFFKIITDNKESIETKINTGRFTRLGSLKMTYRHDGDRLLKRQAHKIHIYQHGIWRHVVLELRMLFQILIDWQLNTFVVRYKTLQQRNLAQLNIKQKIVEILKPFLFVFEAVFYIPRAFYLRIAYYIVKPFYRRPIWLVSDRGVGAGDNGEALFAYINQQTDCPADVYFVLSKKSKDYERIKSIGKVIHQESLKYKLKFLLADKIIASHADIETTNPFIRQIDHYVNLFNFDFIFLQHGIIRFDLSDWLNRFNENIALFITSAQVEYDSIFTNPYYYAKENVFLSGLARYDYLESNPEGLLMVAPTYRKSLVRMKTDRIGRRMYDPNFKTTYYREFYNNVINDQRIIQTLRKHNMKGEFYLHPVFSEQWRDFDENEVFKVMQFPYDYTSAFRRANILVSDYSSVMFDFAYLKKPVLYAQFDRDTFFEGQTYTKSDFFDDREDGYGEVYDDYETLIEGIIETIEQGAEMKRLYRDRVDNFFYKVDKHNSKRIYDAIIAMNKAL